MYLVSTKQGLSARGFFPIISQFLDESFSSFCFQRFWGPISDTMIKQLFFKKTSQSLILKGLYISFPFKIWLDVDLMKEYENTLLLLFYTCLMKNAFSGFWGHPMISCDVMTLCCQWLPLGILHVCLWRSVFVPVCEYSVALWLLGMRVYFISCVIWGSPERQNQPDG
jgi:hypothetical protein